MPHTRYVDWFFVIWTIKAFFHVYTLHLSLISPSSCSPIITGLVRNKYYLSNIPIFGLHEFPSPSKASRPALEPTQPSIQLLPGSISQRVKTPEREADQPPPSSAKIKKKEAMSPLPHTPSERLQRQLLHSTLFLERKHDSECSIVTDFMPLQFSCTKKVMSSSAL
jgi:hypothetical protein